MKSIVFVVLLLPILLIISCATNEKTNLNVLLIGNSSIYYNNMPIMLEVIASGNDINLNTMLIAHGGYTLQDHLNDGRIERILDSLDWDFVVLNEQSTLGENYMVDGFPRVRESPSFYKTVREFDLKIKNSGAK